MFFSESQKDLLQTSLLNPGLFWLKLDPTERKSHSIIGHSLIPLVLLLFKRTMHCAALLNSEMRVWLQGAADSTRGQEPLQWSRIQPLPLETVTAATLQ